MKALKTNVDSFRLRVIARNPKTNKDLLRKLATSKINEIRELVAGNLNTPEDSLVSLCIDKEARIRIEALANNSLSIESIDELMNHVDSRRALARSNRTPTELLKRLANDEDLLVRQNVARNPNCPPQILKLLAEDKSLASCVAQNGNCPKNLLQDLAKEGDQAVLETLAANPICPGPLLKRLAKKSKLTLRSYITGASTSLYRNRIGQALAQNPGTPIDLLAKLKEDPDELVRFYLVSNPACPKEVLVDLSVDRSSTVRRGVAENPKTPANLLRTLAEDAKYEVSARVAINKRCPTKTLEGLARHRNIDVRRSVASSIRTPESCLAKLTLDKNKTVRELAMKNPKLPTKVIKSMLDEKSISPWIRLVMGKNVSCLQQTVETLLDEATLDARLACASHKDVTREVLLELAQDKNFEVVYRVMANPKCTNGILKVINQRVN
ncbi:MAG: hypothetical protein RJQ07_02850 [Pseudomonadales bacterium]